MTVTGERPEILLSDVDFNRRDHPDRPLRPIPPGRDHYADQWRFMREFIFGGWIDIDREVQPVTSPACETTISGSATSS